MKIHPLLLLIAIATVIFLLNRGCFGCGGASSNSDTVSHTIDTSWVNSKTDTVYSPRPATVYYIYGDTVYKTDTMETIEIMPTDTAAIIARFQQLVYYSDTMRLQFGNIIIQDTIAQNIIKSRRILSDFNVPVVKETITVRQPKRTIGYLGISAMGNPGTPIYAMGATFGLKFKNDRYYGIGASFTKQGVLYYSAEVKIPIRFK